MMGKILKQVRFLYISITFIFILNACVKSDCFNPTLEECSQLKNYITDRSWNGEIYQFHFVKDVLNSIDTLNFSEKFIFSDTLQWPFDSHLWNLDCSENKIIFITLPDAISDPNGVEFAEFIIEKAVDNKLWLISERIVVNDIEKFQYTYRFSR